MTSASDTAIAEFALAQGLTIVSKDADFSSSDALANDPSQVIEIP